MHFLFLFFNLFYFILFLNIIFSFKFLFFYYFIFWNIFFCIFLHFFAFLGFFCIFRYSICSWESGEHQPKVAENYTTEHVSRDQFRKCALVCATQKPTNVVHLHWASAQKKTFQKHQTNNMASVCFSDMWMWSLQTTWVATLKDLFWFPIEVSYQHPAVLIRLCSACQFTSKNAKTW